MKKFFYKKKPGISLFVLLLALSPLYARETTKASTSLLKEKLETWDKLDLEKAFSKKYHSNNFWDKSFQDPFFAEWEEIRMFFCHKTLNEAEIGQLFSFVKSSKNITLVGVLSVFFAHYLNGPKYVEYIPEIYGLIVERASREKENRHKFIFIIDRMLYASYRDKELFFRIAAKLEKLREFEFMVLSDQTNEQLKFLSFGLLCYADRCSDIKKN